MRKIKWIMGVVLGMMVFISSSVCAETSHYIADFAEVLDEEEEDALASQIEELRNRWNQDFVVVTTRDAQGKSTRDYADDYYDENHYSEDGVLYLIDLDHGEVWISTSGEMIEYLSDVRIDRVLDAGYEQLHKKEYGIGLLKLLEKTELYLEQGKYAVGEMKEKERTLTPIEIGIAIAAALGCGGAMMGITVGKYQLKRGIYQYAFRKNAAVDLSVHRDVFLDQTITKRRIPQNTSGSSGGGRSSVHTSSSGHTHGGGGRKL